MLSSKSMDGVSQLEHDLHTVFAGNRVPSENAVYAPEEGVMAALNEFASESTFVEPRQPLVLLGPSGGGKSAALSNWLHQRRHVAVRRSRHTGGHSGEFVFWHVVGCSRQSTFVGHMLRRLMTELKHHFEIAREVSGLPACLPACLHCL